jgi:hypothetical protein
MAFNPMEQSGMTGGGSRLPSYGSIYQYGHQNPAGPYAMLQQGGPGGAGGAGGGAAGGSTGGAGDSTARKYLEGVVGGQNTPYNQTTRDSMYSQQAGMAGAAEAGRNQMAAEQSAAGGASPSDPGYQRLIRQSMAARQSQNQQSMGDIDRTANIANQQAQQSAAGQLMGSEDERYALAQGFNQRASQAALGYLMGGRPGGGGGDGGQSRPSSFVGGFSSNASSNALDPYGNGENNALWSW